MGNTQVIQHAKDRVSNAKSVLTATETAHDLTIKGEKKRKKKLKATHTLWQKRRKESFDAAQRVARTRWRGPDHRTVSPRRQPAHCF